MSRYLRIYRTFFVSSLQRELEFRANFLAKLLQSAMWIGFFVGFLLIIYGNTKSVAGWNRADAILLAATVFLMNALASALFMSLMDIPGQVRLGTLDFVVTKPVDSQFWVSARRFNFDQIGTLLAGIAMVVGGAITLGSSIGLLQWIAWIALVLSSLAIYYSFMLALMTTGIWLIRVDNLWVLGESVLQVARFPLDIYPTGLQRFLTFAIPLGFLATVPTRQLVRGFDGGMVLAGVIWALAALALSRSFWRYAMRHYASASS